MKPDFSCWIGPLKAAKADAKKAGHIKGDSDLAEEVTGLLEEAGLIGGGRAWLNHWLTGKRIPTIAEFLALCAVLKIDPASVFSGGVSRMDSSQDKLISEAISIMKATDHDGKTKALTGIKFALKDHNASKQKRA